MLTRLCLADENNVTLGEGMVGQAMGAGPPEAYDAVLIQQSIR